MKEAIVILTLMGCDHSETKCDYIETSAQTYRTESDCLQASESQILGVADFDYPIVLAECTIQTVAVPQSAVADLLNEELHEPPLLLSENQTGDTPTIKAKRRPLVRSVGAIKDVGGKVLNAVWQTTVKTTSAINPF